MGKITVGITIQEDQKEWVEEHDMNLSYMVREMLDRKMKE